MKDWRENWRPEHIRERFAWLPVTLWEVGSNGYVRQAGRRVWLRRVTEVYCGFGEWTAYARHQ